MPKAYMVTAYRSIGKPEALAVYAKLAGPAVQAAGVDGSAAARNQDAIALALASSPSQRSSFSCSSTSIWPMRF